MRLGGHFAELARSQFMATETAKQDAVVGSP
jgi:hypothetical protein